MSRGLSHSHAFSQALASVFGSLTLRFTSPRVPASSLVHPHPYGLKSVMGGNLSRGVIPLSDTPAPSGCHLIFRMCGVTGL